MAVRSWDGDLTYGELDDLSLRLAHHLVQLGVGPEKFVLSCFEKSTWAIVARLAVLRAGGAYISIFATNPPVFLDSVVRRTNPQVLLSDAKFASRFQHLVPNFVAFTPEWLHSLPSDNRTKPCETVRPDNACLVLFTSGSTGQPKGIIQVHQAYATAIKDYARNLRLDSNTRYLHFDDYAFDISNLEFLVPLILGGCCCVPRPMKTAEDLAVEINTLDANISFLTPTVAIKLDPAFVPRLKTLCVGGEPLPKEMIRRWEHSPTRLVNQFGMGEVAICCAYNDTIHPERGATIGRPATGAMWIVDPSTPERLLPLGAVGELVIEGPHLSRRYLDNTALSRTAAGFLQKTPRWLNDLHPSRSSTARMYRSGDLGRLNHDGTIEYIGRKDTILKLDGCRIDAVEVEHRARKSLSPRDAIVVDLLGAIDGHEDPRLTALLYLHDHPLSAEPVASGGEPVIVNAEDDAIARQTVETIRGAIAQALPAYMVPSVFLLLSWMPRTASKKTDRKKIRLVGQRYYMAERERRSKSPFYALQAQQLPR
ncbi:non-ribosomal peptide synthetase [Aspergillus lucknowensis]|uniref:AMP-dependent synthetase/ligase domain-containing protein n=1 Tax=Aspergillus lucknowensis TaxID=176173 RepID=A0ABR4LT53_9EURO